MVETIGGGDPDKAVQAMIEDTVREMYPDDEANRFLEVTYQNGDKEVMYFKDFSSGAMIENIVRRAKKLAIKRQIAGGPKAFAPTTSFPRSVRSSRSTRISEHDTTPTTGRRSPGKKGERIVYVRTLIHTDTDGEGGKAIDSVTTGQYL